MSRAYRGGTVIVAQGASVYIEYQVEVSEDYGEDADGHRGSHREEVEIIDKYCLDPTPRENVEEILADAERAFLKQGGWHE